MTDDGSVTPRLARLLLWSATPRRYRDEVLGDLEEAYLRRAASAGVRAAYRWYWGQVLRSVGPCLAARLRRGRTPRPVDLADVCRNAMDHRGEGMAVGTWARHVRLAVRSLVRRPGFAALAIVTLGLGIGANTAIFSVLHGALLRPLPYDDPAHIVYLSDGHDDFGGSGIDQTLPNLLDLRAASRRLSSVAIFNETSENVSVEGQPERVAVLATTSELLGVLGVAPALGRDFNSEDDIAGAERVALISDQTWHRRFGADAGALGRTIVMDAEPVRIVGVLPADFWLPSGPELLVTLRHDGAELARGFRNYNAVGRLAPGASVEAARAELQGIFDGLVEQYPDENGGGWYTWAEPFASFALGPSSRSLYLLAGAVVLVLLIACVNVANLLLVRAETRQRELAVRFALGAGRSALVPHFVAEGLVLSAVGGLVGVAAAFAGVDLLVALYGGTLPRGTDIGLDGLVLAFSLALSLLVGLVVGLVPVLRTTPARVHDALRDGGRGSSLRGSRLGRALVVTQVALALVLVSAAGLLTKSMWNLQDVDLGLADVDHLLTFQVTLPEAEYETGQPVVAFYDALAADLAGMPGVEAVGFVNRLPLLGGFNTRITVSDDLERWVDFVSFRPVTEGYFDALGMRLISGRWPSAGDYVDGTPVAVINETLARRLFAGEDPLGQRVTQWVDGGVPVIGVVSDVRGAGPTQPAPPALYLPFSAFGGTQAAAGILRTAGDPRMLATQVRDAVRRLDPNVPAYRIRTLKDVAVERLGTRRFAMSLFGVFAGLALLLGAVGIYGVMSHSVAQRSRELGVRLALGARRASVMRMVLREALGLVGPGIVIGLALSLASSRLLGSLLFGVSTIDPLTYVEVATVLALVAVAATTVPARRATRTDPLTSIRSE